MKKKYIFLALLIIFLGVIIVGFIIKNNKVKVSIPDTTGGDTEKPLLEKGKIRVEYTYWSGEPDFVAPEPKIFDYNIELGNKISIPEIKFSFEIVDVSSNSVTIVTDDDYSIDKGSGINLNDSKNKFTIDNNKETELVTPTTDAGDIYKINISL